MDVREKLVELIFSSLCRHIDKSCKLAENIADDLISNGVTVQEDCKDCQYMTDPITNADRIRSMSDEELAELLNQWGTSTRAWQKCKGETMYWLQQQSEGE